ncbi:MAG: outer membrane protein transport protein [Paracoccaceae bacterium]|nr:outer membrane protein transport protein [Paracoccaceae bacterium]
MKKVTMGASALALMASGAFAGGIERTANDYGVLFQPEDQLSFSVTLVNPTVSGDYPAALGGGSTGNMANKYSTVSASYKNDITDQLSFGLFFNQGYGANAEYTQGVYTGLAADWDSKQVAGILKYTFGERYSVYGGVRLVESQADIVIPELLVRGAVARFATNLGAQAVQLAADAAAAAAAGDLALAAQLGAQAAATGARATTLGTAANPLTNPLGDPGMVYRAQGDKRHDMGYVLGAAFEIPRIAMRVALTWESEVKHEFDTMESLATLGIPTSSTTEVIMPQSVALDFQTGVAPGTLVFGQVKWTEWSKWEVRTPGYEAVTGGEVTGFDNDTITYKLGIGRQFNDKVSGFAQMSYEKSNGGIASRLAPTDGRFSIGIGGQITEGNSKFRGGVEYVKLGDATDGSGVQFEGNSALGMGMSFTVEF